MFRIGRTMRSAKMNEMTPPKLMPPFQSKDERDDAAETDAAVPEHRSERHVPDRTDKGQHRHDGPDQRTPEQGSHWMPDEEEALPELGWHPGGERACQEQAARDVPPDRRPVHDEGVADSGESSRREDPLNQRPVRNRHVHLGVAFHRTDEAALGLLARLAHERGAKECLEE